MGVSALVRMPLQRTVNHNYLRKILQWMLDGYEKPQIRVKSQKQVTR